MNSQPKIAVVIPCYNESANICALIADIDAEVTSIFVIDDASNDGTGECVEGVLDRRVHIIRHRENQGVGAATITGYNAAIESGATIIVKMDGDGQMDPLYLSKLVAPIIAGCADYTKGNRFYDLSGLKEMPKIRLLGNAFLSFFTKLSSGYWTIFDPTCGYTAIHASLVPLLPPGKVEKRFFFESDILFRLNTCRAHVMDIPIRALYNNERSSLSVPRVLIPFVLKNMRNTSKRIFYNYFLRDFSVASIELVLGILSLSFGILYGSIEWADHASRGELASTGTIMLAALPIIVGSQLLLSFINFDVRNAPTMAIHPHIVMHSNTQDA